MSATVASQIRHFPSFHVERVSPSGLFPSDRDNPAGSVVAGILAWTSALLTISLIWVCLECLPVCLLQDRPCLPLASTVTPHLHLYGWHKVEPRRRPHAILRDMGSSFSPNDGIGTAWSQSEELGEETANKRAFSSIEAECRIS